MRSFNYDTKTFILTLLVTHSNILRVISINEGPLIGGVMLNLTNLSKSYHTGHKQQTVLHSIHLVCRNHEFISILGQSGSGKSTLLYILGGLIPFDFGTITVGHIPTVLFNETIWDAYRNFNVGFIFQDYNLISHLTVLENVEVSLMLTNTKNRREQAIAMLDRVGLKEHIDKLPKQLSGGQMQRVAIARALVSNPSIILADEPTGALDQATSKQIMELFKEVTKDKLVLMVTHDQKLAHTYSTRIIELQDGVIIADSNPITKNQKYSTLRLKRSNLTLQDSLYISIKSLKAKWFRTILIMLATSISIISVALTVAIYNGFKLEIDNNQISYLSQMPIEISKYSAAKKQAAVEETDKKEKMSNMLFMNPLSDEYINHTNTITQDFVNYIDKLPSEYILATSYEYPIQLQVIRKNKDASYTLLDFDSRYTRWILAPKEAETNTTMGYFKNRFDIIAGSIDHNQEGLILQVDQNNQVSKAFLEQFGFDSKSFSQTSFQDIMNIEFKLANNDAIFQDNGLYYKKSNDLESIYNSTQSTTLKVKAIIRGKPEYKSSTNESLIYYTKAVVDTFRTKNKDSKIVASQRQVNYNVLSRQLFSSDVETDRQFILSQMGGETPPSAIYIYSVSYDAQDKVKTYLNAYNTSKNKEDKIEYFDTSENLTKLTENIMTSIIIILIILAFISSIVACIIIIITTYISVLERTKEIGTLRALGASKRDIKIIFLSEVFSIGILSSALGSILAYLLTPLINHELSLLTGLQNVAKLSPFLLLIIVITSTCVTVFSGLIPANMAAKKNPIEALKSE